MNTPLAFALALHRRGLCVIPVPRPSGRFDDRHDGKVPVIAWREFQDRRPTKAELHAWCRVPTNLAIVTGKISGVVVIDADTPEAVAWVRTHLPYTPWQTQTSRGWHFYYLWPGERVTNVKVRPTEDGRFALDVRGDGGFVIAPGSVHASGAVYKASGDWRVKRDRLPVARPEWFRRPERRHLAPVIVPLTSDVVTRARRYLAKIPTPEIGCGSDVATLYGAARLARGFDLDVDTTVELLWQWAGNREGWTREWIRQKVENALKFGTEPIGALR